jgi:hypothetical protein
LAVVDTDLDRVELVAGVDIVAVGVERKPFDIAADMPQASDN